MILTLIANAGVLLDYGNGKLLLDSLHTADGLPFSGISDALLKELSSGQGRFQAISWLLFTHLHGDHFSPDAAAYFLKRQSVRKVFLPLEDSGLVPGFPAFKEFMKQNHVPVQGLDFPEGHPHSFSLEKDVVLTAYPVRHCGGIAGSHCCFLIQIRDKALLFLGDAEYQEPFFSALPTGKIDAAVANPLFLSMPEGRKTLHALQPARLIISHLPSREKDPRGLRRLAARCIERYGEPLPPTDILWNPLDSILLD